MTALRKVLLVGAACLGFSASAMAADMADYPLDAAPLVPVEVGSGWYLRGDVSYDFKTDLDVKYRSFDGSDYGSRDHDGFRIKDGADFGVGFGYQFTDFFRGDLTARYAKSDVRGRSRGFNGYDCAGAALDGAACQSDDSADMKTWDLMANAYLDLGTFAGFTPYVGGGVGAVQVDYDHLSSLGTCIGAACAATTVSHDGESDWRFAYSLAAGVAYDLTQSLKLDLGYRYLDVDGGDMFGWDTVSSGLGATGVQGKDEGFDRHTVQVGLRYSLF